MHMTMTLDEDLAAAVRKEMERYGCSLEEAVSGLLRRGLRSRAVERAPRSPLVIVDPEVLSGNWTWRSDENGEFVFQARKA